MFVALGPIGISARRLHGRFNGGWKAKAGIYVGRRDVVLEAHPVASMRIMVWR